MTTDPGAWVGDVRIESVGMAGLKSADASARDEKDLQALMDRYKKESGRTRQGAVPIAIDVPTLGPSIFLAAELTAESHAPSIELAYHRTGGRK